MLCYVILCYVMYVCVPAHVFVTWTFVCIWCLDMGGAGWIVALNMSSFAGAIWHFRAHDVSSDDRNFLRWAEESRRCNKHQQAHIMRSSLNRVFCISRLLSALAGFNHVQRPSTSSVAQNSRPIKVNWWWQPPCGPNLMWLRLMSRPTI